jgi:CubicO group peptidase (beta-lactamase class C family)
MTNRRLAAVSVVVAIALSWPLGAQVARRSTVPAANPSAATKTAALMPAPNPDALGFDPQRLARLDAYMGKAVADGRVAGMITLLARHGQVVAEKSYGAKSLATNAPMTRDTIFRLYSMSKPVTGVAMMLLFEEGKWRLDDPITRFVPEFKELKVMNWAGGDSPGTLEDMKRPPTMRQLMSHTAGFGYGLADRHPVDKLYREKRVLGADGLADMIKRTAEIPLMYQPGTRWSYSSAVDIQGYIVEKLSGQRFGDFLQERIFKPLKMTDTAFYVPREKAGRLASVYVGNPKTGKIEEALQLFGTPMPTYLEPPSMESGGGGLVGTITDYARFAQMLVNKGELDGVQLLSPASVEMMGTNMLPKEVLARADGLPGQRFDDAIGFGLDFQVVTEPRVAGSLEGKGSMSWGGAAGTWFWVDPTNDVIFVGMIQRMGDTGGDSFAAMSRTLTYQALVHPER